MKLSHSKLSCILSCPMTYKLCYEDGLAVKTEKPALQIGSAVHWGIEHNTDDLTDFFQTNGTKSQKQCYSREQLLAESMVCGYLQRKDEIFSNILQYEDEKLELLNEVHEVYINGYCGNSQFVGIVDLLLHTNKGIIVIDYKTSTFEPNWDDYLDQIYRYIHLLKTECPNKQVLKIGIINLRKSCIRQKKTENDDEFRNRLKWEYKNNYEQYITYHEYSKDTLNYEFMNEYIDNLAQTCNFAENIVKNELYYINYSAAKGQYGKSDYYDVFYNTPDAEVLYTISDKIYNDDTEQWEDRRDARKIDMLLAKPYYKKLLNTYDKFLSAIMFISHRHTINVAILWTFDNIDKIYQMLKNNNFIFDEELCTIYFNNMLQTIKENKND